MKRSKSKNGAREWVHIQCALWIPEVTMGDPEKMSDPDISNIPESRMSLKCYICLNGIGCIQVLYLRVWLKKSNGIILV